MPNSSSHRKLFLVLIGLLSGILCSLLLGRTVLAQISTTSLSFERSTQKVLRVNDTPQQTDKNIQDTISAIQEQIQTIDVLVLYTPEAASRANEAYGGIVNLITQAVNDANLAYQNSQTNTVIRPVLIQETREFSDHSNKLDDQYLDEIRSSSSVYQLREQYSADLVFVVTRYLKDPVKGPVWGSSDINNENWSSLGIVDRIAAPTYTLAHEFGHNIGVVSERVDMHTQSPYSTNPTRYTIMGGTDYPGGPTRVPYFTLENARRIAAGAVTVAQYRGAVCQSQNSLFCDVPTGHWAYEEIDAVYERGITKGCNNSGTPWDNLPFCPDELVDRAHMAVFLIRRIHHDDPDYEPTAPYYGIFADVPESHPQARWIEELYIRGITTGSNACGSGLRYCPDAYVTRAEIASFLMRTERYLNYVPDYHTIPLTGVFDDISPSNVHAPAIEYMYWQGYTNGCPPPNNGVIIFCPDALVNRATIAVLMARTFGYVPVDERDAKEPNDVQDRPTLVELFTRSPQQDIQSPVPQDTLHTANLENLSIAPASDREWFKFDLQSSAAIRIETSGTSGDTRLWLFDSNLERLNYDDDNGTGAFSLIERTCLNLPLPDGTYYLLVDEYANDEVIPAYSLTVEVTEICQPNTPLSNISVDTLDASLNPKTVFQRGETIWLRTTINNSSDMALDTVWNWRVTDNNGTEVDGMGLKNSPESLDPGLVRIRIRDTVPQALEVGRYTFVGSVRTADGQFSQEANTQFDVMGGPPLAEVFLPMIQR
jgi:hypothetical protein